MMWQLTQPDTSNYYLLDYFNILTLEDIWTYLIITYPPLRNLKN